MAAFHTLFTLYNLTLHWLQAAKKGVSDTMSGVIFGMFALVQFITSPIFSKLVRHSVSDKNNLF